MKKRIFMLALLAFAVLFGNMTVWAVSDGNAVIEEVNYDYYDDYPYYENYNDPSDSFLQGEYYLDENVYYRDESGRFTGEERQKIIDLLKETSKRIGFHLVVYTGGLDRGDSTTEYFASRGSEEIFSKSAENNTVFLYVDLDSEWSPYDYMDCYREPCLYYFATAEMDDDTRTRIDRILEKMQEKFPAGGSHGFFGSAVQFGDILPRLRYVNKSSKNGQ